MKPAITTDFNIKFSEKESPSQNALMYPGIPGIPVSGIRYPGIRISDIKLIIHRHKTRGESNIRSYYPRKIMWRVYFPKKMKFLHHKTPNISFDEPYSWKEHNLKLGFCLFCFVLYVNWGCCLLFFGGGALLVYNVCLEQNWRCNRYTNLGTRA